MREQDFVVDSPGRRDEGEAQEHEGIDRLELARIGLVALAEGSVLFACGDDRLSELGSRERD